MLRGNEGFSLIELIAVIILISIVSVSVVPKFDGTAGYEAHSHRAQLIAALRLTQQRAMQQTDTSDDFCHEIVFDNTQNRYGIPNRQTCTLTFPAGWGDDGVDGTGHIVDDNYQISFNVNNEANPKAVGFDWMGRPTNDCDDGCTINVVRPGEETLSITIESEGYIHVFGDI